MAKRLRMPPAVTALLKQRLRPGECVWHWAQYKPDEVSVNLIAGRVGPAPEWFLARFGEGGCGRAMEFRKVAGKWTFAGEGEWIS